MVKSSQGLLWSFFGDFPNQWIWIGLTIIIASGVYISLRENTKKIVK